jgi:hypothetical protein
MSDIPPSPFGRKLRGRREIAAYHLQDDSPQAIRRISALISEVREENRIPHIIEGDGKPTSYTGWLDDFQRSRAKYLPSAAGEPTTNPQRRAETAQPQKPAAQLQP